MLGPNVTAKTQSWKVCPAGLNQTTILDYIAISRENASSKLSISNMSIVSETRWALQCAGTWGGVWFCPRWCSTCVPLRNPIGVSSTASNNFWECCRSTVPCFSGHLRTGLTSWAQGCSHDLKCITSIPVTPHQTKLSLPGPCAWTWPGRQEVVLNQIWWDIDTICVFDHSFLDASWSQDETYKYIRSLDKPCKVHDAPTVMTLWLWHPDMFGLMPFV